VTVPVARGSARRTVRVAVALVAGQAALCAVIGYLTLGGPHPHSSAAPAAPDPLAGAPLVVPPAQVMPPPATSAAPKPPPVSTRRKSATGGAGGPAEPAARIRHRTPVATSPPVSHPPSALPSPPSPPGSPIGGQLVTPKPTGSGVQQDVTAGDPCSPIGADGRTTDGKTVRCLPDVDGQLRWRLV
jgi:hypothetical protein